MRSKYRGPARYEFNEEVLTRFQIRLSPKTFEILTDLSRIKKIPVARLIAYAVDNEMDCEKPFSYNFDLPTTPYVENQYLTESKKLFDFIKKFQTGVGIDQIVLCRRDFGVEDRATTLHALRELFEKELIESFYPRKVTFKYGNDYKYVRIHRDLIETRRIKKYKEVQKLEEKGPLNDVEPDAPNYEADAEDQT